MSFLEQAMKKVEVASAAVPEELLDEWREDDGSVPAKFLLHPRARGQSSVEDVRTVLDKRQIALPSRLSSKDFVKLAGRVQRRGSTVRSGDEADALEMPGAPALGEWIDALDTLVASPRWAADDPAPAAFSPKILVGSARHAADLKTLHALGVTAVLNCAPAVCEDCSAAYASHGIAYAAVDAEDFEDYPLLEMHLSEAEAFVSEQRARGTTLIHCYQGVNRSATLAIAVLMLHEELPLLQAVARCFEQRPFILTNGSFRRQLVMLAEERQLLGAAPGSRPRQLAVSIVKSK